MAWKIRDFYCTKKCTDDNFEAMTQDEEAPACPVCGDSESVVRGVPTAPAGYRISGDNSASTKPKGAGSFKRK